MLNLAKYRKTTAYLADYLPWAFLVAPGVVLNKDGSFQRTIRYRGPDLDSATEAELVSVTARLNNVLKRFGEGWALFFEAERVPARDYPGARFADAASWLVDEERRAAFETDSAHHESRYFLTFLYLPPPDSNARAERMFYERTEGGMFSWAENTKQLIDHDKVSFPNCVLRRERGQPRTDLVRLSQFDYCCGLVSGFVDTLPSCDLPPNHAASRHYRGRI